MGGYMLKKDLLEKIKNAKDDEDINPLLVGTDIEDQFMTNGATLDAFKGKIKADKAFQQFMDSERDTYHSKALKTMKEKGTWETEFADVLTQKYPDLVTDPAKKEALEAKKEIEKLKAEMARKDLLTEAIKYATEKKLPTSVVDKFLGEDLDKTKANLDTFATDWSKGLETLVNEKLKGASYVPGGKGSDGKPLSIGASIAEKNNAKSTPLSDPWGDKK